MGNEWHEGAPPGFPGRGHPILVTVAAPAAGADWTLAPPVGAVWRVIGGSAKLVTSAVVNNRQLLLQIKMDGLVVFVAPSPNVQAASLTYTYEFMDGVEQPTLVSTFPVIGLPVGLIMDERWRIASSTTLLDVGDQWSAIEFEVEELRPAPPE